MKARASVASASDRSVGGAMGLRRSVQWSFAGRCNGVPDIQASGHVFTTRPVASNGFAVQAMSSVSVSSASRCE